MPLGNDLVLETASPRSTASTSAPTPPRTSSRSACPPTTTSVTAGARSRGRCGPRAAPRSQPRAAPRCAGREGRRGRWAMIVTSDHGGSPLPERCRAAGGSPTRRSPPPRTARRAPSSAPASGSPKCATRRCTCRPRPARSPRTIATWRCARSCSRCARFRASRGRAHRDIAGNCAARTGDDFVFCLGSTPSAAARSPTCRVRLAHAGRRRAVRRRPRLDERLRSPRPRDHAAAGAHTPCPARRARRHHDLHGPHRHRARALARRHAADEPARAP